MVSDLQRRLSLLLVVAIAMSWFVLSETVLVQAADPAKTTSAESILFNSGSGAGAKLAKNTQFAGHSFTEDKDKNIIIHTFQLADSQSTDQTFTQRYTLTDLPVWAGCTITQTAVVGISVKPVPCSASLPAAYNYFSAQQNPQAPPASALGPGAAATTELKIHSQAQAYRFENHPEAPVLIRYKDFIYGIYTLDQPTQEYRRTRIRADTSLANYIGLINQARVYQFDGSKLDLTSLDPASRDYLIKSKVKAIFNGVTATKGVTLADDLASSSETSKKLNPPAPDSPPIVTITSGLSGGDKATFKLEASPAVRSTMVGADNNYFFFRLLPAPNTSQTIIDQLGGSATIKDIYLVIDFAGNIAFVVDNPSDGGGIFKAAATQDRLGKYIAIGAFNADDGDASIKNGGPGRINVGEYRNIITLRVYNEPTALETQGSKQIVTFCATPPIHYPKLNTGYTFDRFHNGLPDGSSYKSGYRKCINRDPKGWLAKWGVNSGFLDDPDGDPCGRAFRPKTPGEAIDPLRAIGAAAGKSLCYMVYNLVGMATTFAKFSVEFLIEAVGVQT